MKTAQDLLDFYGVELGKKYIITDERLSTKPLTSWIGRTFIVKQDERYEDGIAIELSPNKTIFFISRLDRCAYEEVKPEPLTDEEKDYLSAVIKPFRENITTISKLEFGDNKACIYIEYRRNDGEEDRTYMPIFNNNDLYLGMERNKKYTLEELGL